MRVKTKCIVYACMLMAASFGTGILLKGKIPVVSTEEAAEYYPLNLDYGGILMSAAGKSETIQKAENAFADHEIAVIQVKEKEQCGQVMRVKSEVIQNCNGSLEPGSEIEIVENHMIFTYDNGIRYMASEGLNPVLDEGRKYIVSLERLEMLSSLYQLSDENASVFPAEEYILITVTGNEEIPAEKVSSPYLLQLDLSEANAYIQNMLTDPGFASENLNPQAANELESARQNAYQRASGYLVSSTAQ